MKYFPILIICMMVISFSVSAAEPIVLMYHRLSDTEAADAYTITPLMFEQDIKYLKNKGYKFCTATEFDVAVKAKNASDLAVITFDDGYASDYKYALPILEKYNVKATFFIIGKKINTPGYLSGNELKSLSDSPNVQIGNHFYNMHDYTGDKLNSMYKTDVHKIKADYDKNKKYLENITGKKITTTSYPYGIYGNFFDYMLKSEGISRFCSKEEVSKSPEAPFGRYTRTATTTIVKIEERIKNSNKIAI